MTANPGFIPALVLRRQLEALALLQIDVAPVLAQVGELPLEADALVPVQRYHDMWSAAQAAFGLPGLPTALAMAIPFGALGAIDYLGGSAVTVGAACRSVQLHLSMVAVDVHLQHEAMGDGTHVLEVHGVEGIPAEALEFSLAMLASRLRYLTDPGLRPLQLALPMAAPADDALRLRLWGLAPSYGYHCASFTLSAAQWAAPTRTADPYLHDTLQRVAAQLQLGAPVAESGLEQALRARLRDALAQGRADAERLAGLLGVSERTLQRRLHDIGRSFSAVVEDFRCEEAMRLLSTGDLHLVQIADRLGYAEQTSFTRAFRRWTGQTPGVWRAARVDTAVRKNVRSPPGTP